MGGCGETERKKLEVEFRCPLRTEIRNYSRDEGSVDYEVEVDPAKPQDILRNYYGS